MISTLSVTSSYAALLTIFLITLAYRVVLVRRKVRVGVGDGGKKELQRAIGAHQNAAENIPIMLILMALYEYHQSADLWLHLCAGVFTLGRLLNAWGVSLHNSVSFGRYYGMWMTVIAMVTVTVLNIAYTL